MGITAPGTAGGGGSGGATGTITYRYRTADGVEHTGQTAPGQLPQLPPGATLIDGSGAPAAGSATGAATGVDQYDPTGHTVAVKKPDGTWDVTKTAPSNYPSNGPIPGTAPAPSGTMTPERLADWEESMNRARALADKQSGGYDAAGPRAAPQAGPVTVGPAAQAGDVQIQRARDIAAPGVERATVGGVAPMQAAGVDRAIVAPVERVQAAGVERAIVGQTGNIDNATIARTEDQQTRDQQQQSIQGLQAAAAGTVPSAAENQAKLLADRALKQQYAVATALQGTNTGSALRSAAKGGAEAQLNIAADAFAGRAAEQASARGLLASTLGTVRGQDIGVNTEQAKLVQDARVRNQAAELATKLAQGDIDQKTYALASQNLQNSRIANQQMELQRSLAQGEIDQKTFAQASQNLQNARTANQQTELQRALAQGEIDAKTFIARSQMILDAETRNQQADVTTNVAQGQISSNLAVANISEANKVMLTQAGLDKDVKLANQLAQLQQTQMDDVRKAELGRQMIESEKIFQSAIAGKDDARAKDAHIQAVQQQIEIARQQLAASKDASERAFWGGIISSGLQALGAVGASAALASDMRAKTNITDGDGDVMNMLDKLKAYGFDYKNPKKHGEGNRIGIMAQDAQKSPLGKSFTLKGKTLSLDVANALGAALAASANLHARLKKVEGRK